MTKHPIQVGLTGGIGSGKTTIAKIFSTLDVPVYNSDIRAKAMLKTKPVKEELINCFGDKILSDKSIDNKKLAKIVFNNKQKLEQLNAIIHPKVLVDYQNWLKTQTSKYIIKESALLIETGLYKKMDKVILVVADFNQRINRVVKRDNVTPKEVKARIHAQLSDEEKYYNADFIITNNNESKVIDQVLVIHNQLITK